LVDNLVDEAGQPGQIDRPGELDQPGQVDQLDSDLDQSGQVDQLGELDQLDADLDTVEASLEALDVDDLARAESLAGSLEPESMGTNDPSSLGQTNEA